MFPSLDLMDKKADGKEFCYAAGEFVLWNVKIDQEHVEAVLFRVKRNGLSGRVT